jgi:tRNA (guanine-N7-)-methyltransferase
MSEEKKYIREIKSFVRREGRMTKAQKCALEKLLPIYELSFDKGLLDFKKILTQYDEVVLEVGFGMGRSLIEMAEKFPQKFFIGVEVHRPGVGSLLQNIHAKKIENVRVICHDAVEVLKNNIPNKSLDIIQIFFPDPWPKKRHHKRRLIQPEFVQLIRQKLKPGGILHVATDWQNYAEYILEVLHKDKDFVNLAEDNNFSDRSLSRPSTKFEERGKKLGHEVWDLIFEVRHSAV